MLIKDKMLLENLTKKYGKYNIKNIINEDSLDDFDIDGSYARARANAPQAIKNKIHKLLNKNYFKIVNVCRDFFKEKGMNITYNHEFCGVNKFVVHFPELFWSFTYDIKSYVTYKILVGDYGRIGVNDKYSSENIKLLKELGTYIANNIKGMYFDSNSTWDVRESSDGYYVISISAKLNELRLNNKRKKANPLDEWFKALSIEQLELVTGVDCEDYDNEKEFRKECEKWWKELEVNKQERYFNKFDKFFNRG